MDCINYVSKPERRKPAPKLYIRRKAGCNLGMNSPCDQRLFHNYSIQRTPGLSESKHQENQQRTNYRYQKGSITKAHSNLAFKLASKILLFLLIWMESRWLWLPPQHGAEMSSGYVCESEGPHSMFGYKERWSFKTWSLALTLSNTGRLPREITGFRAEFWGKNSHKNKAKILSDQLLWHWQSLTQLTESYPTLARDPKQVCDRRDLEVVSTVWNQQKVSLQNPRYMHSIN